MTAPIEDLETNIRSAFRAAWAGLVKAATATNDVTVAAVAGGATLTRLAGSWITDGHDPGDEVTLSGFAQLGNNGVAYAQQVTALVMTVALAGMVNEVAGAAIQARVLAPKGLALELRPFNNAARAPVSNQPWLRDKLQLNPAHVMSLGAQARVRIEGVYWLTIFYPSGLGSTGVTRFAGQILKLLYPGKQLIYNGQLVTIRRVAPKTGPVEADWVSKPMAMTFYADAFNPA